jgi:DNA-binding NtrC family response regulator
MATATVLVVDDEKNIRRTLRMVLESEGHDVHEAGSGEEAEELLAQLPRVDVVIMDVKLPGRSGVETLERVKSGDVVDVDAPIVMISGHATVEDAVRATKLGAFDFLEKPLDRERVVVTVRNAVSHRSMQREVGELRAQVQGRFEMVGGSRVMDALFNQIAKVAPTKGRVLITGESGTGKELIARAIHKASSVASGPFVKVNCAAIPAELIESELFGHERGAFTGATGRKRGLFEVADGGTIFLDEIGDMTASAQAKVLRVLQTGELVRVGGERTFKVDTRVLAATNKDLAHEVQTGGFREDLFFRLNVVPLHSPSLRERREDIPLLADSFVEACCRENGFRKKALEPGVIETLQGYDWPGNVRELKNVMERLVIMSDDVITAHDLPGIFAGAPAAPSRASTQPGFAAASGTPVPSTAELADPRRYDGMTLREFRDEAEREFIRAKLDANNWNISRTSQILGIERTNLHKKLRALGITRNGEKIPE